MIDPVTVCLTHMPKFCIHLLISMQYTYVIMHSHLAKCINLVYKWLKECVTSILFDVSTFGYSNQLDVLKIRSKNWADVTQDVIKNT